LGDALELAEVAITPLPGEFPNPLAQNFNDEILLQGYEYEKHIIPLWVASMIQGQAVHINGDGQTTRDFCYIDNVVQANLLAATVGEAAAVNQVYNIALGEGTTLNQLFETMRRVLESRAPHWRERRPLFRDFRPGDVRLSQADIGKAQRLLGYRPAMRLQEGLALAIDWYAQRLPAPQDALGAWPTRPADARAGAASRS
jgi:nucleoside-diphosphate-sugar epimerase